MYRWWLAPRQGREESALEVSYHLITLPSLSQVNTQALLTPYHSLALGLECPGPGKILDLGMQRLSRDLRHSPGGVALAIVSTYYS